ncbi:MAG: LytTR family DNA-binding domain-containing protein [Bacteroidales bacterium]|nr:LytTR family DNA-binding domain-containing protein [Bacteroidales bacterium]
MEHNYTAIIIDDEKGARDLLSDMLGDYPEIKVIGNAANGEEGLYLLSKYHPDIAFLDIDMPGKNGVEVLREMHHLYDDIKVIFTTAYEEYAVESIKYHPFGYMLKPLNPDKLHEIIFHVKSDDQHHSQKSQKTDKLNDKLKVCSKEEVHFINFDDITHLSAEGNYTRISLTNRENVNVTAQLGKLEEKLPKNRFFKINRSEVVNINYIRGLRRKPRELLLQVDHTNLTFKVAANRIKELHNFMEGEVK